MEPSIHWLTCVFCPSSCCNTKQCSVPKKRLLNVFWSGCQGFASSQKQENRWQETLGRIFAIQITAQNFEYVPLGLVRGYPGKIWKHYTAEKPKKYKQYNFETSKILVFLINAEYFHYDPLWLVGGILEICTALSLNLLMTQTVIQEPASLTCSRNTREENTISK